MSDFEPGTIIAMANNDQPTIIHQFESAITKNQLGHAFLFIGPTGRGQEQVADWLAMRLMCVHPLADGNPDGICNQCVRIAQHEHPDVVELKPDGNRLKIEQIRFLQNELTKTAVEGDRKVLIIHAADTMTTSAANGLLKSIEEPMGQQTIILLANHRQRMLPTIVSRTQVIEFQAISAQRRYEQLRQIGYSEQNAKLAKDLTDDLQQAQQWLVDGWFDQTRQAIERLMTALLTKDLQAFNLVQIELMPLAKAQTMTAVVEMLIQACRDVLLAKQTGAAFETGFSAMSKWQQAITVIAVEQLVELVELALAIPKALDMNMNAQTTLESFVLNSQKAIAG